MPEGTPPPEKITLREQVVIETWEGDPPAEGEEKPPKSIEVIVYENGVKVQHTLTKGDDHATPQ